MGQATNGAVLNPIRTLFRVGSCAGLTDAQLLERFASHRGEMAEAAFETLVARHGPMVFGVCRRILRDRQDAEDAFQATFLVLVRKARSIRVEDSLGGWLYAVTHRIALRARARTEGRRLAEVGSVENAASPHDEDNVLRDLRPILHEEIRRLPEKYRAPIVLCYLEEMTHDEAASHLGWPLGTVRGRLARARDLLRSRLTRRGLTLSSASMGLLLSREASAALPPAVAKTTITAAMGFAAAGTTAGTVSAASLALTMGVLRTMFMTKIGVVAAGVLAAGIVTAGAGMAGRNQAVDGPAAQTIDRSAESEDRGSTSAAQQPRSLSALDRPITLTLDKVPLKKAVELLGRQTGLNFVVDPTSLAEEGLSTETPVTLACKEIRLRQALKYLLDPLHLTFEEDEGGVLLITKPKPTDLERAAIERQQNIARINQLHRDLSQVRAELRAMEILAAQRVVKIGAAVDADPSVRADLAEVKALEARLAEYEHRAKDRNDPSIVKTKKVLEDKSRALAKVLARRRAEVTKPEIAEYGDESAGTFDFFKHTIALLKDREKSLAREIRALSGANSPERADRATNSAAPVDPIALSRASAMPKPPGEGQSAPEGLNSTAAPAAVDERAASSPGGYLEKTRKEVEEQLESLIREMLALSVHEEKERATQQALKAVRTAILVAGSERLSEPLSERERTMRAKAEKSSVQQYLQKARIEIENEIREPDEDPQGLSRPRERIRDDFRRLRVVHIALVGGRGASTARIRAMFERLDQPVSIRKTTEYAVTQGVLKRATPSETVRWLDEMLRSEPPAQNEESPDAKSPRQ